MRAVSFVALLVVCIALCATPLVAGRQFTAEAWPYSHADPPCTTYASQDNCVGSPPVTSGTLPACGNFTGATSNATVFGILGDYGLDGNCESLVVQLVAKLQQQFGEFAFIMTTGDNAYWTGSCESYTQSVLNYYGSFLPNSSSTCTDPSQTKLGYVNPNYSAAHRARDSEEETQLMREMREWRRAHQKRVHSDRYSDEPLLAAEEETPRRGTEPRFYPTIGNHDWTTYGPTDPLHLPYLQVFDYLSTLPPTDLAHGQFYVATPIPGVELYSLNSNLGAPGATADELALFAEQVDWLKSSLTNSTAAFKFVFFHHPPYCTAQHDALAPWMELDYEAWGASAVFSGHEHMYERLAMNKAQANGDAPTMPYIVNGLGGHPWTYTITGCPAYPGSQVRYNAYHGLQIAIQSWDEDAQAEKMDICFYSLENGGSVIDHFQIPASA